MGVWVGPRRPRELSSPENQLLGPRGWVDSWGPVVGWIHGAPGCLFFFLKISSWCPAGHPRAGLGWAGWLAGWLAEMVGMAWPGLDWRGLAWAALRWAGLGLLAVSLSLCLSFPKCSFLCVLVCRHTCRQEHRETEREREKIQPCQAKPSQARPASRPSRQEGRQAMPSHHNQPASQPSPAQPSPAEPSQLGLAWLGLG